MKEILERPGQVDFTTTANIFNHLLQDAQASASDQLGEMMAANLAAARKAAHEKSLVTV